MPAAYGNDSRQKNNLDPYSSASFMLEIDGIKASFSKASGIASEVEYFSYHEGGVNHFEHRLPVRTIHSNVVLERGTSSSLELWKWFDQISSGVIARKNFSVVLWNGARGEEVRRWDFTNGYPVKWCLGELDALSSTILIESLELAHEGFTTR